MHARKLYRLEAGVLAVAFVVLALGASGGPGWAAASTRGVLAARLEHSASAPLYDLVAGVAALLPFGEIGFRLGLLGALLGACTLAGIVAAARALVPKEPTAGAVGALLLVLAPPFREALATPQLLAACGATWAIACAARYARDKDARDAASALAACAIVVGTAPWLGAALVLAIATWLVRNHASKQLVALAFAGTGALVIVLWWRAIGEVPGADASLAYAIAASGRGAVVVGAGLLGIAFGAATGLPNARWLAVTAVIAGAHEVIVGGSAIAMLAIFAIGVAIVAAAIARMVAAGVTGPRRDLVVTACGLPFVIAALAIGVSADDPGSTPTQLASDLVTAVPPGPGVFVAMRPASWFAIQYERTIAGARPDLVLVPPLPSLRADAIAVEAMRAHQTVAADAAAFGRLDVRRAVPRGRGFQLVGELPKTASPVLAPARYATATGAEQAVVLAIERARIEAASDRLDAAARAAGLTDRFRAADLAVLAVTLPTKDRPLLFDYLPLGDPAPGPWLADTFGDDLAYVGGLAVPTLPPDAPMPRRLLAKWRDILADNAKVDDPALTAMGPRAVAATTAMARDLKK